MAINGSGGTNPGFVGIGTTAPSSKLDVRGVVSGIVASGAAFSAIRTSDFYYNNIFADGFDTYTAANGSAPMLFRTGGSERMRIDSSGNVGIGTTTPSVKLNVTGIAGDPTLNAASGIAEFYLTSTQMLAIGGYASGSFGLWLQGKQNNAGYTTATFPICLNPAGGNVGIGTSSPSDKLQVTGGILRVENTLGYGATLFNTSGMGMYMTLADQGNSSAIGTNNGSLIFYNSGNTTERMRIDSSGNVGIGVSNPGAYGNRLGVGDPSDTFTNRIGILTRYATCTLIADGATAAAGAQLDASWANGGQGPLRFTLTNSEKMRIDSSGNLLVGKTAVAATVVGAELAASGRIGSTLAGSTNATSTLEVYSTGAAAYRFFVDMAGTINATNTSIAAISDIRLKENVRDLDAGLDTILALKPRRFDWKEGKGKDVKDDMGFIAQEVEEVLPALIGGWKAGEGEPDDLKSVKAGDLIPVLVKAIQELTARVAQLEGK
jgi:hypothetical protein